MNLLTRSMKINTAEVVDPSCATGNHCQNLDAVRHGYRTISCPGWIRPKRLKGLSLSKHSTGLGYPADRGLVQDAKCQNIIAADVLILPPVENLGVIVELIIGAKDHEFP